REGGVQLVVRLLEREVEGVVAAEPRNGRTAAQEVVGFFGVEQDAHLVRRRLESSSHSLPPPFSTSPRFKDRAAAPAARLSRRRRRGPSTSGSGPRPSRA